VTLAHTLADAAAEVTRRYFRTPVPVDAKQDASPVTIADREAEAAMREVLRSACPDHGIFGEEQGYLAGGAGSDFLWVLDPIDGTKSFITGACTLSISDCIQANAAAEKITADALRHSWSATAALLPRCRAAYCGA
jgi:fructose-1,6-bisphosphatase/inositol monophosphatase family enzyme